MPKGVKRQNSRKSLENLIINFLLFIVNLFIEVGEATKLIISFPFKFLNKIYKTLKKNLNKFFSLIVSLKGIFKFKIPKIKFKFNFKFKFPKFKYVAPKKINIKLPRLRLKRKIHFRSFLFGILVSLFFISVANTYNFVKNLPSPTNIGKTNYSLSTHILDRNQKLLYDIYRDQNKTPVKIDTLPKYVYDASIAIEDKDFFKHNGISPIGGIIRALKENLTTGKLQGGSTITQQLVKSALLTPERTIRRKIKEIILALWTERIYSKSEILQMY